NSAQETVRRVQETEAVSLVMELMAIPGKSGEESRIAAEIQGRLRSSGVPTEAISTDNVQKQSPLGGEQGNLIVKLPGTMKGPRRLFMAHIDTVPLCVGSEPVRRGGKIVSKNPNTALGGDDRAGASVLLNTLLTIQKH